ncbi:T9SS type A sorting domain-containing protein [Tunicatimonas pelagia]|uniref:T9SS type A sorting domain-containing protein n=1 Tax=Tunicatimonas pelagia TaxID=931531 RepID=UPI00266511F4|nr:T9SS type A sorting domain-containing protein [Tunicatimonas pelagia]WKN45003.1 T9SS type A sorting domain-containing protein [Tunicatimonas pelagia]
MKKLFRPLTVGLLLIVIVPSLAQTVVTYPAPTGSGAPVMSDDYDVSVEGQTLDVYRTWTNARVQYSNWAHRDNEAAMAYFDFSGTVTISVTVNHTSVNSYKLYPSRAGISASRSGNTITFSLTGPPKQLVLKINDDWRHSLHIFANPLETNIPNANDANVRYFGPGVHTPADGGVPGRIELHSDQTLYIAGGAVVKGIIRANDATTKNNVTIRGRGILQFEGSGITTTFDRMINIRRANNLTIRDIIVLGYTDANETAYSRFGLQLTWCNDVVVDNLKYIGHARTSDGPNVGSCRNVMIKRGFFRAFDDASCIKGFTDTSYGNYNQYDQGPHHKITEDVWFEDCILVCDKVGWQGNAINMAWQTYTPEIKNSGWKRIDIIRAGGHTVRIEPEEVADANVTIKNVLLEDIRIEEAPASKHFEIRAINRTNRDEGGSTPTYVQNVTIKNFRALAGLGKSSQMTGNVSNFVFENLQIEGQVINSRSKATDNSLGKFSIGSGVGVSFSSDTPPPPPSGGFPDPDKWYHIRSVQHNKYIQGTDTPDATGSASCSGTTSENVRGVSTSKTGSWTQWRFIPTGNNEYRLENRQHGHWLQATNVADAVANVPGTEVCGDPNGKAVRAVSTSCTGTDPRWKLVSRGSGKYNLENVSYGSYLQCLDDTDTDTGSEGGGVQLRMTSSSCMGSWTQWNFVEAGSGASSRTASEVTTKQGATDGSSLADGSTTPLQAYPNPAQGYLHVQVPQGSTQLAVYNVQGQQVLHQPIGSQAEEAEVDVASLTPGLYLLKTYANGQMHQTRWAKQ